MLAKTIPMSLTLIVAAVVSGCGTVLTLKDVDEEGTRYGLIYSGIRFDCRGAFNDDYMQHIPFGKVLCIADMPFSVVADTLILPVTCTVEHSRSLRSDERLYGTWKADENLTVSQYTWFRDAKSVSDQSRVENTKPLITISHNKMVIEVNGLKKSYRYRIVKTDANSVTVVGPFTPTETRGLSTIRFDETGLWYLAEWSGNEMHYRRQHPSSQSQ